MSTTFTAPSGGGDNKTKLPVPLLPNGTYPGILVAIVDCGTQTESFQGKPPKERRVLKLSFEIPNQKAQFYVEDTELKPRQLTLDFTFMMYRNKTTGKKTNLLNFVESAVRVLNESEYNTFEISQMSGQYYNLNVVQYTKADGVSIANKIGSVLPFQNYWPNENLTRTGEVHLYHISMGFDNIAFASLPFWLRTTIKESAEAKAYAAQGGKFAKFDENKNLVFEDATAPQQGTQGIAPKVRMKNPQHSYPEFIKLGWSDEILVGQGFADWVQLPQAPPAVPPTPPAPPQAPPPVQQPVAPPQAVPAPIAPVSKVIMNPGLDYQAHLNIGWTDETLVQNNMAVWNPAAQASAPIAPPVAPPPVAPPPVAPPQAPTYAPPASVAPPAPAAVPQPTSVIPPPQPPSGVPPYTPPPPQVNDVNQAIAAFAGTPIPPQSVPPTPTPVMASQVPVEVPPSFNEEEHDDLPF